MFGACNRWGQRVQPCCCMRVLATVQCVGCCVCMALRRGLQSVCVSRAFQRPVDGYSTRDARFISDARLEIRI